MSPEELKEKLIGERDDAEQALSHAYFLVIGQSPKWSNLWGHEECLEEIDEAQRLLRQIIKDRDKEIRDLKDLLTGGVRVFTRGKDAYGFETVWHAGQKPNATLILDEKDE